MKTLLIVLDGWGVAPKGKTNAITKAKTPFFDELWQNTHAELRADGKHVGLLPGYIGNSEVGHLHLGAGRLVEQDLKRIFNAIKDGSFFENSVLVRAMKNAAKKNRALHLLGLVSDGGVHSHIEHLFALIKMAKQYKVSQIYVHAILDGRDVPPKSAATYLKQVAKKLPKNSSIATIMGRFYAMDRDNRWKREHKAYDAMVNGKGRTYETWQDALDDAYAQGETDEFVMPSIIDSEGMVREGDSIVFFNFRSDRAREITRAFVEGEFSGFKRKQILDLTFVCLTQYDENIDAPVAFKPINLKNTLGEVVAKKKLKQFRLAETEKWAHVTFFFNGLCGRVFDGEDRLLIPSPKVKTYEQTPAMSAPKIAKQARKALDTENYSFVLINFANADMVGHTGDLKATVDAVETLDNCLGDVVRAAREHDYAVIITADHGNAEQMRYPDGTICTAHTTNHVPCIILGATLKRKKGFLYDVAPTVLTLLGIKQPKEMTGRSLI